MFLGKIFKFFKRMIIGMICLGIVAFAFFLAVNIYALNKEKERIITVEKAVSMDDYDCIIVLGASVKNGDTPSVMLRDRLDKGIELYKNGAAPKIIMSGDHGGEYYNEVGVMKKYAVENGVPSSDVFMDHAGFSTYETMYRAKEIFGAKKVLIVTQRYHLTRALYIANALGLEAYGVATIDIKYGGELTRGTREFLAIGKDFILTKIKIKPTVMGDKIDLAGDGDVTNDKDE